MSPVPPPVPADAAARHRPSASFVTVLAWIVMVAAALGVAYGIVQVLLDLFMPEGYQLRMLNPGGGELPPLMQWYYANTLLVALAWLLLSAALLATSRGLLQRREWARRGFIALLVLGTLWQLGMVWVVPQIIEGTMAVQMAVLPAGGLDELGGFMASMTRLFTAVTAVMAVAFAALHAWIVWKLCTASVRAEFDH